MKAIETVYRGFRFRSRLEARWAVFFDTLPIKWEYEKEGFDLENGLYYLPDFWFPQVNMWGEIKPDGINFDMNKILLLVKGTKSPCLLLRGFPENKGYLALTEANGEGEFDVHTFCLTNYHNYIKDEQRFYCSPGCSSDCSGCEYCQFEDTEKAVLAARRVRFEYGE